MKYWSLLMTFACLPKVNTPEETAQILNNDLAKISDWAN